MLEMGEHGWGPTTQCRELENIQGVLRFVGNGILDRMKAKYPHLFPKRTARRGPSLVKDDREKVIEAAAAIKGWGGEVAKVPIWPHMMTGLKPRELRTVSGGSDTATPPPGPERVSHGQRTDASSQHGNFSMRSPCCAAKTTQTPSTAPTRSDA